MNALLRLLPAAVAVLAGGMLSGLAAEGDAAAGKTGATADPALTEIKALYQKADGGDAQSQFLLGAYYDRGVNGLPQMADQAAIWYQKAAEQGNANAQSALGTLYNSGRLGEPDHAKALRWYQAAAKQGNPLAEYNIGYMHYAGRGLPRDDREALRWIGKAAAKGFDIAQTTLGRLLYDGHGLIQKNHGEAFRWFELAARQGNGEAQYYCGKMLFLAEGVEQDYVRASSWLRLAAVQNVPKAARARDTALQILTTQQNIEASGIAAAFKPKTPQESTAKEPELDKLAPSLRNTLVARSQPVIPLMLPTEQKRTPSPPEVPSLANIPAAPEPKAAQPGPATTTPTVSSLPSMPRASVAPTADPAPSKPAAMPTVAVRTSPTTPTTPTTPTVAPAPPPSTGSLLPPVHEFAPIEVVRVKLKADEGDAESQYQMGRLFTRGKDVNQNFREALKWHTKAAQQGHVKAQITLGTMHHWGRGVPLDLKRAAQWLRLAAEKGNPEAQYHLGVIFEHAQPSECVKWFQAAAERGSHPAQIRLAEINLSGIAGTIDHIEAYKWLELAANQGSKEAAVRKEALAETMSVHEVGKAEERVLEFIPKSATTPLE